MTKKIRISLTPSAHQQYNRLKRFVNGLWRGKLHGHARKNLVMISYALLEVRRAVLSELAREIVLPIKFNHRLRRIWRFLTKTNFDYQVVSQALLVWVLTALKDRKYLEIILDWTQIRQDHVLVFSIPYHKRAIPVFWSVTAPDDYFPHKLEEVCLYRFLQAVPKALWSKLVLVADRGFAKVEFFQLLQRLGLKYVIRVCGKVWIVQTDYQGVLRKISLPAKSIEWLPQTVYRKTNGVVLNLLLKDEKTDPVYLVSNLNNAETVLRIYARRMTIEEGFRDLKNGFFFNHLRLSNPEKVGKMLLVGVLAYLFALIMGSNAERMPQLMQLITITTKHHTQKLLSVFRIGLIISTKYQSIKIPLKLVREVA